VAENLKTAAQINQLLTQRKQLYADSNKALSRQVAMAHELCKALAGDCGGSLADVEKRADDLQKALLGAKEQAEKTGSGIDEMAGKSQKASKKFSLLKGAAGFVGGAFGLMSAAVGAATKVYSMFMNQATKVYDEMLQVSRAAEETRDKFGSLSTGVGGKVQGDVKAFGKAFSEVGVSMGFGYAAGAELQRKVTELYAAMDPAHLGTFMQFTQESRVEMGLLGLSLGLGGKELGSLAQRFKSIGKDAPMELARIKNIADQLETAIGVDAKAIGKSFAEMSADVKHFGDMNTNQMGDAIAKASQLGIGIKELASVSEAFFAFDKAAENVSKLSQAFGTNIDTMAMLEAENPADQMDILRDAMFAAGKSAESMSRHEKALLGSTLGLNAAQTELMFSQQAQYMSQSELDEAMAETDPQQQMIDALKDVGKEIKSVVVSLGDMGLAGKGFFGAFMTGLGQGLFRFGPFAKTASTTAGTMMDLRDAGMDMAKTLTKEGGLLEPLFTGINEAIGRIPDAVEGLLGPMHELFDAIAGADATKIQEAFSNLGEKIKEAWESVMGGSSQASAIMDSIKATLLALWVGASSYFMEEVWPPMKEMAGKLMSKFGTAIGTWAKENWKIVAVGFLLMFPSMIPFILKGAGSLMMGMGKGLMSLFSRAIPQPPGLPSPRRSRGFFAGLAGLVRGLAAVGRLASMMGQAMLGALMLGTIAAVGIIPLGLVLIGLAKLAQGVGADMKMIVGLAAGIGLIMGAFALLMPVAVAMGAFWPVTAAAVLGVGAIILISQALLGNFVSIIKQLADLAAQIPDPGKVEKVASALAKVVDAMANLMKQIGPVLKTLKPGLFSKNRNDKFQQNIKLFTDLIDKIMGSLTSLLTTLVAQSAILGESPQKIKGAEALGSLIGAVTGLINAVAPDLSAMQASHSEYKQGYSSRSAGISVDAIDSLSGFYEKLGPALKILVKDVIEGLMETVKDPEKVAEVGKAIGPMFKAISGLMGSVRLLANMKYGTTEEDQARADAKIDDIESGMKFLRKFFSPRNELNQGLMCMIEDMEKFKKQVEDSLSKGNTIKSVVGSVQAVVNAIVTMLESVSGLQSAGASAPNEHAIGKTLHGLGKTIRAIQHNIFGPPGGGYEGLMQFIGDPRKDWNSRPLRRFIPVLGRVVSRVKKLAEKITDAGPSFSALADWPGVNLHLSRWGNLRDDLADLVDITETITSSIPTLADSATVLNAKMPSVKTTALELNNLTEIMNSLEITKASPRKLKKSLKTLRKAVEGIGTRVEELVEGIGPQAVWEGYLKALQPFEAVMTGIGKSFVGIERGLAVIFSSAGAPITSAAALVERLGDPEEWNAYLQALLPFQPIMVSIATVADQVLQGTTTLLKAAIGLNTLAESDNMGLGTMESWEPFGDRLDSLADLFENQIAPSTEQLLSAIVRFSVALPKIHEQINLLDTVKIKAAMVQAGATALFQQDGTSIEVTGEDANVEFHINITMDAAQVADAMVSSGVLAGTKEQ
jgi:hypothetical protein